MTEFQRICLVHYHEIGLKGHNRSTFEMRLLKNLEALLSDFDVVTIHRISGRLCVFLREGTDWETEKRCADFIRKVPGVARVSSGYKCERDLAQMEQAAGGHGRCRRLHQLQGAGSSQPYRFRGRFHG